MYLIKTEIRSRLSNKSINSITRIKMNNLSVVFCILRNASIIVTVSKNNVLDKQREKCMYQKIHLKEGVLLLMLKVVSATFLLVCFSSLKESTCGT